MKLSHFTAAESLTPYSVEQSDTPACKPRGLWVSVDGPEDWLEWCTSEEWGIENLVRRFRVTLTPEATMLHICSLDDMDRFNRCYGWSEPTSRRLGAYMEGVSWDAVALRYQGIIIAPYQWKCRLAPDYFWYYGWDCASGCIWDAAAIAEVSL